MNEQIMRCYYYVTKNETNLGAYRGPLHRAFLTKYPNHGLTEQNVADQRRSIIRNNLIPEHRLEQIKQEVARELAFLDHEPIPNQAQPGIGQTASDPEPVPTPSDLPEEIIENETTRDLRMEFTRALLEFEGTNPLVRPSIPRQNSSRRLAIAAELMNNMILPNYLEQHASTFDELHTAIYAAAVAIVRLTGGEIVVSRPPGRLLQKKGPAWMHRLTSQIKELRGQIGRLTQYIAGNRSKKVVLCFRKLERSTAVHTKQDPPNNTPELMLDTLHQKLSVKSKRLKRYKKSADRKRQNMLFRRSEKGFYRGLREGATILVSQPPTRESIEFFWRGIWADGVEHEEGAQWIASEERRMADTPHG